MVNDNELYTYENLADDMQAVADSLGISNDNIKIKILFDCINTKVKQALTMSIQLLVNEFELENIKVKENY